MSPKMVPRWCQFLLLCVFVGGTVGTAHAQRSAARPAQAFGAGVQLYEQQLYPQAATALEAFRKAHPLHPAAPQSLYLEARSALATGNDAETRRLLDRLQNKYPSHARAQTAQLGLAQYYLEQDAPQRAKSQLRAIAEDPYRPKEGARALYLLGRTEQKQGNLNAALSHFEQVYSRYPDAKLAPAAIYAKGVVHVRRKEYDLATTAFEQLGAQYPDSGFSQNLGTILGEVYYRLEQYTAAADELQQRLPDLTGSAKIRALFLLGETYNQLGQSKKALTQYRTVLDRAPNSAYAPPARYGLAWQHYRAERYEAAAEAFAKVRSTDGPLATKATYYEAVNRALLGEQKRAVQLYRKVLDAKSEGRLAAEAQYEVGLLLYQQKQYGAAAEAFRAFTRGSAPKQRTGNAYYWLGNAYLASNQLDRALEAYSEAIDRGSASKSVTVEVRFQKAWTLYQNGRYEEASSLFRSLADKHPETDRGRAALFWGADTFYQQERYARARTRFQRYLDTNPDGPRRAGALYALAWTHFQQRQFQSAARRFRQFLSTDADLPDSSIPYRQDAQLRLGDCYFALKRYDDAIAAYENASGAGAEYATYQTGRALYFADRPAEALDHLRRFVERSPNSPWRPNALYRIGDIHFQQQRYEKARSAFRQLIKSYPDDPQAPRAQYAIGDTYYNAGQMEKAVEAYRTVLETYPQSPTADEAASSLFFALNAAGQQDRADELITSISESNPDAGLGDRLRYQRARAAYQRGDSKRSLRLFRSFVRTAATDSLIPGAYYHLGLLYADLDQSTEAKNYLGQLVDQYPESKYFAEGSLRLGEIYLNQEAYKKALSAYRAAAEDAETSKALRAQARYGQGKALLQLGRIDAADQLLSQIIESEKRGPLRNAARLGLGRVREQQGRPQDALALYRKVVKSADSETGAEALYRLGQTLRKQGDARAAIDELERMSSLFAGYPEWEARALLEQARAYRDLGETGQAVQLYEQVQKRYAGTPFAKTAQNEKQSLEESS